MYSVFRPQTGQAKGNVSLGDVGTPPSAVYLDRIRPLSGKLWTVGRGISSDQVLRARHTPVIDLDVVLDMFHATDLFHDGFQRHLLL